MHMCLCDIGRTGGSIGQKRRAAAIIAEGQWTYESFSCVRRPESWEPQCSRKGVERNSLGGRDGDVGSCIWSRSWMGNASKQIRVHGNGTWPTNRLEFMGMEHMVKVVIDNETRLASNVLLVPCSTVKSGWCHLLEWGPSRCHFHRTLCPPCRYSPASRLSLTIPFFFFYICLSGTPRGEVYKCLSSFLPVYLSYSRHSVNVNGQMLRRNSSAWDSGG